MIRKEFKKQLKYDNRMVVSYPNEMVDFIRKWSNKKGISYQDFQRRAIEFYVNHLEHDNMDFQKF